MKDGAIEGAREVSTRQVDAKDSMAYWADLVCAHLVQVRCEAKLKAQRFQGRIVQRELPSLSVSHVRASAQRVLRTPEFIARANEEHILVNIQRAGRGVVRQGGREAVLLPGDMALYSSDRHYELAFDAAFWQTVLIVPAHSLRALLPEVDDMVAMRLPAQHMASRLMTQFADALLTLPHATPSAVAKAGGEGLLATLAAGVRVSMGGLPEHDRVRSHQALPFDPQHGLDALDHGVMALDATAQLHYANRRAQALLRQQCGVRSQGGRIVTCGGSAERLDSVLQRVALSGQPESLALRDANHEVTHGLTISRITQDAPQVLADRPHAATLLVFITTPGQQRAVSVRQLMQMFGLTPAEARLAHALGSGDALEDFQCAQGVKPSTTRTQMQAVFRKTGTCRQQDLIRLLACLPAVR